MRRRSQALSEHYGWTDLDYFEQEPSSGAAFGRYADLAFEAGGATGEPAAACAALRLVLRTRWNYFVELAAAAVGN